MGLESNQEISKTTQITVEFKNNNVELENIPLCTSEQILQAEEMVGPLYIKLGSNLPDGHPWKEAKIDHATHTKQAGAETIAGLQLQLVEENSHLLSLVAFAHDLG